MSIKDIPYDLYEASFRTGSSVICNPPVTDTDIDYMFYTTDMEKFSAYLVNNKWETNFTEYQNAEGKAGFRSFRLGKLNAIITDDEEHFNKFQEATKLATKLNLLDKQQRITLFNYVCTGELQ